VIPSTLPQSITKYSSPFAAIRNYHDNAIQGYHSSGKIIISINEGMHASTEDVEHAKESNIKKAKEHPFIRLQPFALIDID